MRSDQPRNLAARPGSPNRREALRRVAAMGVAMTAHGALTSCGGGDPDEAMPLATPESAINALRAQARALRATPGVTAQEAAEQLLDAGERSYPAYFPGHKASARFEAFAYRYYPETGIYLGVVVASSATYALEGVYVMGGPFGNAPSYVGQLTQYVTPTPTASPAYTSRYSSRYSSQYCSRYGSGYSSQYCSGRGSLYYYSYYCSTRYSSYSSTYCSFA